MAIRWTNMPKEFVAHWCFLIETGVGAQFRGLMQRSTSSYTVAYMSLLLSIIEVGTRVVTILRANRTVTKILSRNEDLASKSSKFSKKLPTSKIKQDPRNTKPKLKEQASTPLASLKEANIEEANHVLDLYTMESASNMLAEHSSMWIVAFQLIMSANIPYLTANPGNLVWSKILVDFIIQLFFELLTDAIGMWYSFNALSISPMKVLNQKLSIFWMGMAGAVLLLSAIAATNIRYECMSCVVWGEGECLDGIAQ